ncbi:MAG: ribbon-helix-helix protein, CopG family [Acidimicrobiia bacterium]|nr:ribbon-helix-helix protein, CopG family [Acidimicrobiia bacterium]
MAKTLGGVTRLVVFVDDKLVRQVDRLVDRGVVASRSDAVRRGLRILVDLDHRCSVVAAIVDGYRRQPQTEDEAGWSDQMARAMIATAPW